MRSCWEKEPINQSKKVLSINVYLLMCQRMQLFIIHVLVYTLKWKVWGVLISTPVIWTFWMQGIFQALYALVLLICMFCKFLGCFFFCQYSFNHSYMKYLKKTNTKYIKFDKTGYWTGFNTKKHHRKWYNFILYNN